MSKLLGVGLCPCARIARIGAEVAQLFAAIDQNSAGSDVLVNNSAVLAHQSRLEELTFDACSAFSLLMQSAPSSVRSTLSNGCHIVTTAGVAL